MTKTIQLTTALPSEWVAAQRRRYLDASYYSSLIGEESADVYKPDGSPLLLFRKGALPLSVCSNVRPAFRKAGRNGGGDHRPYQSATTGYFHDMDCRTTYFTAEHFEEWLQCVPFIRECDRVFCQHLPSRYSVQRALASRTDPKWVIADTAFTTVTVNLWDAKHDARTPVHTDSGDLREGFGVISVLSSGSYVGGYLIFPKWRVAVDLRTTDVLLCDVHEYHANAPISGVGAWERISTIHYYRSAMQQCSRANTCIK